VTRCVELYNQKRILVLLLRLSKVSDVFDLSASDNWMAPSLPILLPVLSENEMKRKFLLLISSDVRVEFDVSARDNLVAPLEPILFPLLSENEIK
jgi:hypothetical protein